MNKAGFTLIELLVAMAIASLLGVALFMSLLQTNRAVKTIDETVDFSSRAILVTHQMSKDLAGVFIPEQARQEKKEDQKKSESQEGQPEQAAMKPLTKIFYGTQKDDQFNLMTFITNNALQGYSSQAAGKPQPFVARIVYRLVPEKTSKGEQSSYALMRQQDSQLDFSSFNDEARGIRTYELIGGIKKMTVKYTQEIAQEQNEAEGAQEVKTTAYEYKVVKEWNKEEADEKQGKQSLIPYALDIDITLWGAKKTREKNYTFKVVIIPEGQQDKQAQQAAPSKEPESEENQKQKLAKQNSPIVQLPTKQAENKKMSALERAMDEVRKFVIEQQEKKAPKA